MYGLDFVQGNSKDMADQAAWFEGRPELQHEVLGLEADTAAYAGHLAKAREITRRAVEAALHGDNKESAALWQLDGAWRESLFGNPEEAKQQALAGVALDRESSNAQELAALILARVGDNPEAQKLMEDANKRYPQHSIVQSYWLPTIRAQLALTAKDYPASIAQLQNTSGLEYGSVTPNEINSCLYSIYLRGETYLAAGQDGAAAEFQKIIDHPGVVWNCTSAALAHLELGRAYARAGDRLKAKAAYEEFLTLWKDADPDIAVLKTAKAESARLQ
jgi:eukaryotic-like serine/threonine-protein kinase